MKRNGRIARVGSRRRLYQYEILVDGKVRWRGTDSSEAFLKLSGRYPRARIAIRWIPTREILIASHTV